MRAKLHPVWNGIFRRPSRTLLTVAGIAIGVLMVVLVSLIGRMGTDTVNAELEKMGLSGLSVSAADGTVLTEETLARICRVEGVTTASPLTISVTTATMREVTDEAIVCGIGAGATQAISLERLHGRLLSAADMRTSAEVCTLDEQVALAFYGRTDVVGKTVTVSLGHQPLTLRVVGITRAGSDVLSAVSEWVPGMIYIPYTTMQDYTGSDAIDQIAVRVAADADYAATRRRLSKALGRDGGSYLCEDLSSQREQLSSLMNIVIVILTAVSGVSLVVSGLSIMTVMLVSVGERTREIGIKKALGAGKGRICAEFFAEAVIFSAIGTTAGMALGLLMGWIAAAILKVSFALPVVRLVTAAGCAMLMGAAFGVYPAMKAAALPPIDALRSE